MNRLLPALAAMATALALHTGSARAQEPEPEPEPDNQQKSLELPFFDDFSEPGSEPSQKLWAPHGASVSVNLPMDPPSAGAVVMDAVDKNGNFYPGAGYGTLSPADTLESMPINLDYPGNQSIYLSYFYQRGGLGDLPEERDSLVLEFYSPSLDQWIWIKSYKGGKREPFAPEMIPISGDRFLQDGFRFRFRNYISLGSQLEPDLVANCDFWMIDYIHIDQDREPGQTQYADVALTSYPEVRIGQYQLIPWSHYSKDLTINYSIKYRNNDSRPRLLDSMNMVISSQAGTDTIKLGSYNVPAMMDFDNQGNGLQYTFTSASPNTAQYQIEAQLVSDASQTDYAPNNKLAISKTLQDCYAYDDGTAEAAYGLHGEGSSGGLVAVRFAPLRPDYINGVYIYFCPVYQNKQASSLNLKIWSCHNGMPQAEIYSKDNVEVPKTKTGQFTLIPLQELVEVADTFFVGWEKNENAIIAAGFDKNTTSCNPKYYNIGGRWKQSNEKGQIMIRPAFGGMAETPTADIQRPTATTPRIRIYPNPASESVHVEISPLVGNNQKTNRTRITITDMAGRTAIDTHIDGQQGDIPLHALRPGTYIIHAPQARASAKLIKTK